MTRTVTVTALLSAALALVGLARPAAADCGPSSLEHRVLSHGGDELPAGGGVLVGWQTSSTWQQDPARRDPAGHGDWRFVVGKRKVRPRLRQLAPGLAVYVPGKVTSTRPQTMGLVDGVGATVLTVKAGRKKRAFAAPAPRVTSIALSEQRTPRGDIVKARAELAAAAPADAVALVVYDAAGEAISWVLVRGVTTRSLEVYTTPSRCGVNPPGMRAPPVGAAVTLAWVDGFGRSSARSAEITVVDAAP